MSAASKAGMVSPRRAGMPSSLGEAMHFVGAAIFKAFGSGGLRGEEEEDLGFGSGDDEEGENVAEGGGSSWPSPQQ